MSLPAFPVLICEKHLDTFGHVNNAVYLELYEEARWEIITAGGFGLGDIRRMGLGPVVLEVNVKFIRELKLREKISITTEIVSYEGKIGKMLQQMTLPDGTVASEALFVFGLFDLTARKLVEPTPEWKTAIGIL
jgi:acyl-CoA thioester hydrolase